METAAIVGMLKRWEGVRLTSFRPYELEGLATSLQNAGISVQPAGLVMDGFPRQQSSGSGHQSSNLCRHASVRGRSAFGKQRRYSGFVMDHATLGLGLPPSSCPRQFTTFGKPSLFGQRDNWDPETYSRSVGYQRPYFGIPWVSLMRYWSSVYA